MFGIGMTEMLVIAVIALVFIGPDQIPEVARTVGRFLNDLRRSTDDIKRQFTEQAGLPTNLNNIDQWARPTAHLNRPPEQPPVETLGVGNAPTDSPIDPVPPSEVHDGPADPYSGMSAEQLRHVPQDNLDTSNSIAPPAAEPVAPVADTSLAPIGSRPAVKKSPQGSDQT